MRVISRGRWIIRWSRLLGGRQRAHGELRISTLLISLFYGAVVGVFYGSLVYGAVWWLIVLALLLFLEGL